MENKENDKGKKKYHSPKLTEYGDVQELTEATGTAGGADGGWFATMIKTQ